MCLHRCMCIRAGMEVCLLYCIQAHCGTATAALVSASAGSSENLELLTNFIEMTDIRKSQND